MKCTPKVFCLTSGVHFKSCTSSLFLHPLPYPIIKVHALSVYHFKLCEFQKELFGADVLELDGGFGAVACAFDAEDFATTETVVEDEGTFLQFFPMRGRKAIWRGCRLNNG